MILRGTSRVRGGLGAAFGTLAAVVSTGISLTAARPASAQEIERVLAGIRLNSKSSNVLAKYGNPNEVVIGDVGIRGFGPAGQSGVGGGQGGGPDSGGIPGGGPGGGLPGLGGGGKNMPGPRGISGPDGSPPAGGGFGAPPASFPGAPGGGFGAPSGGGFGAPPGEGGDAGAPGGGFPGSGGGAIGGFGQTVSTLARQQEVTWIYNRKVNNNLVSYNFLIGPNGNVIQILISGYSGGNSKTKRGIGLGSTYKDVVRAYGYPEEHAIYGRVLVASYRTRAHVSFQFLSDAPQANPMATGNKVIGVTIATVE